jgi:hypothetical protein
MLGYQGFVLNAVDVNNTFYTSNVAAGGNYYQENTVINSGYSGKLAFNAATSTRINYT